MIKIIINYTIELVGDSMVFSSIVFLFLFLPVFLCLYIVLKKLHHKNIILLLSSLLFYAWGEPIYVTLMVMSIIINFFLTKWMDKYKSKKLFILSMIFNIGLLLIFKYTDFFIGNINNILSLNISFLNISLPIGISFYTFQIMTYVIDVYRKKVPVQNNIINLGCYISSFPQLIAGPIVRYSTVSAELENRKVTNDDYAGGIRRFILGLAKKIIIANQMAYVADHIFALSANEYGFAGALIGIIAYTLQIYFDFSGYSDMAIGLGRMLGFHYLENFNYPYIATSITDFWRRWHISLSSFFKDYVYIPLGGNRVKKILNIRNILIVWLLTGLWHGASWNFVLWGLYYGIILIIEKFILKNILEKAPKFLQHTYSIILIMIGWVIFRGTSVTMVREMFMALFGGFGLGNIPVLINIEIFQVRYIIALIIGILISMPLYPKIRRAVGEDNWRFLLLNVFIIILFILSLFFILVDSYNPFIYFRF